MQVLTKKYPSDKHQYRNMYHAQDKIYFIIRYLSFFKDIICHLFH